MDLMLDAEDGKLLSRVSRHEKLSKADILRRALREYAKKSLPVEAQSKVA
jgi:hypothetical protein